MKIRLKTANFTRDGKEYALSCLFLISSPPKNPTGAKSFAAKVKDVVCMVSIKPTGKTATIKTCFN